MWTWTTWLSTQKYSYRPSSYFPRLSAAKRNVKLTRRQGYQKAIFYICVSLLRVMIDGRRKRKKERSKKRAWKKIDKIIAGRRNVNNRKMIHLCNLENWLLSFYPFSFPLPSIMRALNTETRKCEFEFIINLTLIQFRWTHLNTVLDVSMKILWNFLHSWCDVDETMTRLGQIAIPYSTHV